MRYALIGEKLGHSYSALLHQGLTGRDYELCQIPQGALDEFMNYCPYDGFNVTIPYKLDIIPYCTELTDRADRIGSVNTVVRRSDGSFLGDNTDYEGFRSMARFAGIDMTGRKVMVLGNGGVSKTIVCAAYDAGASEVYVVSRSVKANDFDKGYERWSGIAKPHAEMIGYDDLDAHRDADVIVNTTPVGMYPNVEGKIIDLSGFVHLSGVIDLIYNPYETRLIKEAKALGIPCIGGLYMLIAQACEAAAIFLKYSDDPDYVKKRSVAVVGMPGSGKSTIAKIAAEYLPIEMVDTDEEIVKRCKMSIPEIFKTQGEQAFRDIEATVISEVCDQKGVIISTGGGSVLRESNREALGKADSVIWMNTDLAYLATSGRPLSKSPEALQKMFEERMPIYRDISDIEIKIQ